MAAPKTSQPDAGTDTRVVTKPKKKVEKAKRWCVVFYNDHYTTKWFVVDVLERFFHMSETSATAFMLVVHTTGRGIAQITTRDIAETKVDEVRAYAKEWGMPLRVEAEPDEEPKDE